MSAEPSPELMELLGGWIRRPGRTPLIGIAGCQGSGKTTLARTAAKAFGAATVSLDDFYLSSADRQALAAREHPLFVTRGVPGTHDMDLAGQTVTRMQARVRGRQAIPVFDKLADERRPQSEWRDLDPSASAVLVEGWCLGALAQSSAQLAAPVNALEETEDRDGRWRWAVNRRLQGAYAAFIRRFDAILFLKAPSWDVVLDWRCEQEAGLLGLETSALPPARRAELARFVQHYERISRWMMEGGARAEAVAQLRLDRTVQGVESAR